MTQPSAATHEAEDVQLVDSSLMMKVFYVFLALALLSAGISAGGKWFGKSIALAGHTNSTTLREIVIGNNVIVAPDNMIRFERERHDGTAARLDLYLRWPEPRRLHRRGTRRLQPRRRHAPDHLLLVRRADHVARHERPPCADLFRDAGQAGQARSFRRHTLWLFRTIRLSERGAGGGRTARRRAVRGAMPERRKCRRIAGALRARHPCRRQSEPVLPVSAGTARPMARTRRRHAQAGGWHAQDQQASVRPHGASAASAAQPRSMSSIAIEKL